MLFRGPKVLVKYESEGGLWHFTSAILASLKGAWEDRGVPGSLISFYLP